MAPSDPSPPDPAPPPDNVVAFPPLPAASPPRRVRFLDLVAFALVLGGGIFVASIAAMAWLGLDRMQAAMAGGGTGDAGALMVATALCFGVALPAIGIAVARHGRAAPGLLGFAPVHPGWLWRAALMVLALSVFLDQVVLRILTAIFGDLKMSVGDMVAAMTTDTPQALLAVLLIGGLAPLVEELVFRGLVWGWLTGRWGVRVAIPVSSGLFALAHVEPLHVALVFPIGLLLGWLRWRTGSIWPPIAAHVANNAFAVIATWALG